MNVRPIKPRVYNQPLTVLRHESNERINERINEQTNERVDERTNERVDERTSGRVDERVDVLAEGVLHHQADESTAVKHKVAATARGVSYDGVHPADLKVWREDNEVGIDATQIVLSRYQGATVFLPRVLRPSVVCFIIVHHQQRPRIGQTVRCLQSSE